ncbi:RNA deprotection pyrophosphohydrolase [Sporolactobacillus inulinus]|uniref:7,8-dihydro-8-oxoguanine-triphosphatase n=1 Tax=Sporolactobacillus inulinus CASD TaxID=1069536 RepID=A0A0U1QPV0_9BACL|nr:nucleoside triphosphatase YtkD [Sporolactobacillus inulinus]KLI02833.1 7,8-dihydro-8-oxoguanine-triphosphatase [Sporolactobacillus inulinus CASD]GEB75762.1 putative 8-oxo-dGTP diphosphatase YtkD [Sporolactobacillus inulinus]
MGKQLSFPDFYGNKVTLALLAEPFSKDPRHVWVVCRFNHQWLLTRHSKRGLEFPGGKVESGEQPEAAARREVFEETGAHVAKLFFIGQYQVEWQAERIIKNIYFAEIDRMEFKKDYLETDGPKLIRSFPNSIKDEKQFSFIMKDRVFIDALNAVRQKEWLPVTV